MTEGSTWNLIQPVIVITVDEGKGGLAAMTKE